MPKPPSKATALLRAVEQYSQMKDTPEYADRLLRELPDEQFTLMVQTSAVLFSQLKAEAERRGIWEKLLQPIADAMNEAKVPGRHKP